MFRRLSISALAFLLFCAVGGVCAFAAGPLSPRPWLLLLLPAVLAFCAFLLLRRRLRRESAQMEMLFTGRQRTVRLSPEFATLYRHFAEADAEFTVRMARMEESRHQLEVLLEGMQDGVLGVDAGGRVQWTNAQMGRLMGMHGLGSSIRLGRSLVQTLRDPVLLSAVQRAVDERSSSEVRSATLLPGRIFDVNTSPLPDGGAVAVLHDVTRAEAMERTQREFVANVSHELRTPLTSIMGYVETLLDIQVPEPQARDYLETVLKNATRMNRLTEDLLLLARVEDSERKLRREPVSAGRLLDDALKTALGSPLGEEASFDVQETTQQLVLADEHAVLQVLGNLIENAVKYGGLPATLQNEADMDGSARVLLSVRLQDDRTARFCVQDFGPGIALEHQSRIFERFYRVDKARSRESGGTGLGLAIAKHLIEQHGGTLTVTSVLGQGSTFCFTLPTAEAAIPGSLDSGDSSDSGDSLEEADSGVPVVAVPAASQPVSS